MDIEKTTTTTVLNTDTIHSNLLNAQSLLFALIHHYSTETSSSTKTSTTKTVSTTVSTDADEEEEEQQQQQQQYDKFLNKKIWRMALPLIRALIDNNTLPRHVISETLRDILHRLLPCIENRDDLDEILTALHKKPDLIVFWAEEYMKNASHQVEKVEKVEKVDKTVDTVSSSDENDENQCENQSEKVNDMEIVGKNGEKCENGKKTMKMAKKTHFSIFIMGEFLLHLLVCHRHDDIERLFDELQRPNSFCYDVMIQSACKKQVKHARHISPDLVVFDLQRVNAHMKKRLKFPLGSIIPFVVVIRSMSHFYGTEDNVKSLIEFMELVPEYYRTHTDVVSAVLLVAARWTDVRVETLTMELLWSMKIRPDNALLMLSRVAKTNQKKYVDYYLKKLEESGYDINVKSLNAMLRQLLPKNNISTSIELFTHMRNHLGVQQDLETVELFANYFINNTLTNLKTVMLRDDHRDALLQTEKNIMVLGQFSSFILNQLLKALLQYALIDEAFDMLHRHHCVINEHSVYVMLTYFVSTGELHRAQDVIEFFKQYMVIPGDMYKVRIVTSYLQNNMNHDECLQMIRDIVHSQTVPILEKLSLLDRVRALYLKQDRTEEATMCRDWKYHLTQQNIAFLKKRNKKVKSNTREAASRPKDDLRVTFNHRGWRAFHGQRPIHSTKGEQIKYICAYMCARI